MVTDRAQADDLAVGAVDPRAPQWHPGRERGVELLDGGERPARQDVVADDQHLALDPALAPGPVGGQHVDVEVVVAGERDRLGVERNRFAWGHGSWLVVSWLSAIA
ncbi:hypothetical protein [Kitasatospora aureofaciens]|uniref:hypothetical protein n=1 Tax=Kitasatospora aureofaciens TaxID=1894 RepID=UPI003F4D6AD2